MSMFMETKRMVWNGRVLCAFSSDTVSKEKQCVLYIVHGFGTIADMLPLSLCIDHRLCRIELTDLRSHLLD